MKKEKEKAIPFLRRSRNLKGVLDRLLEGESILDTRTISLARGELANLLKDIKEKERNIRGLHETIRDIVKQTLRYQEIADRLVRNAQRQANLSK